MTPSLYTTRSGTSANVARYGGVATSLGRTCGYRWPHGLRRQHSLQFVDRRFRRTHQDSVAVVNVRHDEQMYECGRRSPCRVNAKIVEVDVTSRNWTRWRWRQCWSKLKSDYDIVTLSRRTWSRATVESEPSCRTGRQQSCWERLCLDPTDSNSVLSALSLRWLADIQWPTSMMHCSRQVAADAVSVRRQCRYSCVSSAKLITVNCRVILGALAESFQHCYWDLYWV